MSPIKSLCVTCGIVIALAAAIGVIALIELSRA